MLKEMRYFLKMEFLETCQFERIEKNDYIKIKVDGVWVSEHIYIVEQFIGRKLNEFEVVHHIDSNKKNNLISNLMLFSNQKEHQKFHNKIRRYGYTNPILREVEERWKKEY